MTGDIECRYHGRDFTAGEMALLRALIAGPAAVQNCERWIDYSDSNDCAFF